MRNSLLVLIVWLGTSFLAKAQLNINPGVDTLNLEVKSALRFYQGYLDEFKKNGLPDFKKYWSLADQQQYKIPDQMIYAISSDYPTYKMADKHLILYIKPSKDYVQLKTQFSWLDTAKNITTLCITNHYVKFDDKGQPYFINPVALNSKDWKTKVVRNITYHYAPYHTFNQKKADSLQLQIKKLEKEWGLGSIPITYYFAATNEEIGRLRGFDYSIGMGNADKPSGISDHVDNLVYCSGWGENYFHEVVHIYLNHKYPKSPLQEGLAVFYGGSLGQQLSWHLKRLNTYLIQHPEIDLNKLEDFWQMDNFTNPDSAIQGMLCRIAFKKGGIAGLKKMMSYESLNEIFQQEFGLAPDQLNTGLRKIIKAEQE
ncbi:hypothetical protein H9X96_03025 [Pedobacter sp. N36a]|uniref:hypothetical protein n=1 Tax=Pedobacter sp. N36a TaxID=2767996 RepID=UPI001656FEAA|nr:hypothetical protein [Pedobacter sp. N36a]MBC8984744.1 hypothetical protein [Pedobacter sp. N36a]